MIQALNVYHIFSTCFDRYSSDICRSFPLHTTSHTKVLLCWMLCGEIQISGRLPITWSMCIICWQLEYILTLLIVWRIEDSHLIHSKHKKLSSYCKVEHSFRDSCDTEFAYEISNTVLLCEPQNLMSPHLRSLLNTHRLAASRRLVGECWK